MCIIELSKNILLKERKQWLTKLLTTVLPAAAAKVFAPAKLFRKATANSKLRLIFA